MKKFKQKLVRTTAIFLTAVLLICAAPLNGIADTDWSEFTLTANALDASGSCGDNVTYTYNSETGEVVISGKGEMWDYVYFNANCNSPFWNSSIISVVIEDGVISIGSCAFYGCTSLINVTISDSIESVGNNAFYNCTSITNVTIPDSAESIGNYAFYGCTSLEKTTIGNSIVSIGDYAFRDCTNLESIVIPDSVESIGKYAFQWCTGLTTVTIGKGITSIGSYPFYGCSGLEGIMVDENNESYSSDDYGVLFDKSKTNLIIYPRGNDRTSYTIPNSVASIGDYAFHYCDSLTSIEIPDSVESIGDRAFMACAYLESIKIPNSVTSIGESAFYSCGRLTSINIPDSVESIGDMAFSYAALKSVTIGNGVTNIGYAAFQLCIALKSVTIGNSIKNIDAAAFYNCTSLENIIISDSVETIDENAFYGCKNLSVVHYRGTKEQWDAINISSDNTYLTDNVHMETMVIDEIIPPTCTESGYAEGYKCSLCDFTIEGPQPIDPLGHSGGTANCTDKAVCGVCGEEYGDVDVDNHKDIVTDIDVPATCTSTGLTKGSHCEACGEILVEQIITEKLPHTMGEWATTQAPTCTEAGEEKRECANCNYYETNALSAIGHTEEIIPAVPATCKSTGLTEGTKCSVCGEILVDQTVTEMLSHSMGEWITTQSPVCSEPGEEKRDCTNCDYYETNTLSATGHTEETIPAVPATCTSTGLTEGTKCSACGEILLEQAVTGKLSHSYKTVVTSATCTTGGYITYTCSVCGDSYIDAETSALDHNMGEFTVTKMPTCTENGKKVSKCLRCDYSETQEISATGHSYENGVCADCGDSNTKNCSCNCHKSGFMGFIWKILNFFYKIFGTNKVCECGMVHY